VTYESGTAESFIYGKLTSDFLLMVLCGGRIYNTIILKDTPYPCIVFQWQGSHDVMTVGDARIMVDSVYVVKAVHRTALFSEVKPIFDRADLVLHGASGSVESGVVYSCVREQMLQLVEQDGDVQYRHYGGVYRIRAKGVPATSD
jgi:hypothetical protein